MFSGLPNDRELSWSNSFRMSRPMSWFAGLAARTETIAIWDSGCAPRPEFRGLY